MKETILFSIYQLKITDENEQFVFLNSGYWKEHNKQVRLDDYDKVETNIIESDDEETTECLLDRIYEIYNFRKPEHFKHRSVSVSDIIVLQLSGSREYYFVDSIGFKKLHTSNIFDF